MLSKIYIAPKDGFFVSEIASFATCFCVKNELEKWPFLGVCFSSSF